MEDGTDEGHHATVRGDSCGTWMDDLAEGVVRWIDPLYRDLQHSDMELHMPDTPSRADILISNAKLGQIWQTMYFT